MTGVFIKCVWTCFEGNVPGSYSGTVANAMAPANTIGYPLWDDILAYAKSKGMKVHVGIEWQNLGSPSCVALFPTYLVAPGPGYCGGGTDSAGTYGVTVTPAGITLTRLWKAAVMDRFIAMVSAVGARYDDDPTLDAISIMWDDSNFDGGNLDGYSFANTNTQLARFATQVRAAVPHTGFYSMINWWALSKDWMATWATSSAFMFDAEQDALVWDSTDGDQAYVGAGDPYYGTHDYRPEVPVAIRLSKTTQCTIYNSYAARNGLPASGNTTPAQYYDYWFNSGKVAVTFGPGTVGKPIRPSYVIIGGLHLGEDCPSVAHQQFFGVGGWLEWIQTHPLNTTRPSFYH